MTDFILVYVIVLIILGVVGVGGAIYKGFRCAFKSSKISPGSLPRYDLYDNDKDFYKRKY